MGYRKWVYAWYNPYRWALAISFDWVPIENFISIQIDVLCFSVEIDLHVK